MNQTPLSDGSYKATLTRERFLFHEMRTTARLMSQGCSNEAVVAKIAGENLFQYPTEKSIQRMAKSCIERLKAVGSEPLVRAVAEETAEVSKQICLYAMMKHSRLVWDFMTAVVGEKYRTQDLTFGRKDFNVFFIQMQERDDAVAAWSDSTVRKIKSVLCGVLIDNGYLDHARAGHLNQVWLSSLLEGEIRRNGDLAALPAFHCFS